MDSKEELIRSAIRQLVRVARKFSAIEDLPVRVDDARRITTSEAHAIEAIGECEEMNVTQLADNFGVTKSAASQMAAKLHRSGYIRKKPAPHSRKETLLSLTDMGRRAFEAHERSHGRDMAELVGSLSGFSVSQVATVSVLLEAIGAVMDERLATAAQEQGSS